MKPLKYFFILFLFAFTHSYTFGFESVVKVRPDSHYFSFGIGIPLFSVFHNGEKNEYQKIPFTSFSNAIDFHAHFTVTSFWTIGIGINIVEIVPKKDRITPFMDEKNEPTSIGLFYLDLNTLFFLDHIGQGFYLNAGAGIPVISVIKGKTFTHSGKIQYETGDDDGDFLLKGGFGYAFEEVLFERSIMVGIDVVYARAGINGFQWKIGTTYCYAALLW